jgi:hypothetical protein
MFIHETLSESEPGIYTRYGQSSTSDHIQEHYRDKATQILQADQKHYKLVARKFHELFTSHYTSIADIAGGHPKLASHMSADEIIVYDAMADMYESLHDTFLSYYPTDAAVCYQSANIISETFKPTADLAICAHILEHLTVQETHVLLYNIKVRSIMVYGPNISCARNAQWLHYNPEDHVTFCTIGGMERILSNAGYQVLNAYTHDEDMIIFADNRSK